MAAGDENLRAILDHRGSPSKSKEERKYYESMMRRLGYSEAEMAKERPIEAPPAQPVAAAAPPTHSEVVEETGGARLIELEYGGAEEIPEFEPVRPKIHPSQLEETEYNVAEAEAIAGDNEFVLIVPDDDDVVDFDALEDEEELVEFTESDGDWEDWGDNDEPAEPAPAAPRGHRYKTFTLYRRELDGGQHVYFYSRKAPSDADPADVPEGYGVKESEESGLPYLARLEDGATLPDQPEEAAPAPAPKKARPAPVPVEPEEDVWEPAEETPASGMGFATIEADSPEEAMAIARKRGLKVLDVASVEME